VREEVGLKVPKHEVPHRIVVLDRIPLSVAGKADRKVLIARMLEYDRKAIEEARPLGTYSPQERELRGFLKQEFGDGFLNDFDCLEVRGLPSLALVSFLSKLQAQFGIRIDLRDLYVGISFDDLVELLPQSSPPGQMEHDEDNVNVQLPIVLFGKSRILRVREDAPKQVILIPGFGGTSLNFSYFFACEADFGFVVAEQRGSVDMTPRALAEQFFEMIGADDLANSSCICGYSSGGTVAVELAGLLQEKVGHSPIVMLLDTRIGGDGEVKFSVERFTREYISSQGAKCPDDVPFKICQLAADGVLSRNGASLSQLDLFWRSLEDGKCQKQIETFQAWRPPAIYNGEILLATASKDDFGLKISNEKWEASIPSISFVDFRIGHGEMISNDGVFQLLKDIVEQKPNSF
jgi:hypothetical protein